jgi:uncharacterized protein (TIGR04255 family)
MVENRSQLPSFKNPPVVEVAMAVQFEPLTGLATVHYGEYRRRIRADYPRLEEKPPLGRSYESFSGEQAPSTPEVEISELPPLRRCWFVDKHGNSLVQMDSEHFVYNWRNETGAETYPRYESVRKKFRDLWSDFLKFLEEEGLGEPRVNHWEISYVNHLDKGQGWDSLPELGNVLHISPNAPHNGFLPAPEALQVVAVYAFPEKRGRLRISLQNAVRRRDMQECMLLKLISRGHAHSSQTDVILGHFDVGREWIVRAFAEITTEQAHALWGRER